MIYICIERECSISATWPVLKLLQQSYCYARFHKSQLDNPSARWLLSEGFSVVYADIEGEMVVGGVFLRLFVANPGWVLRKPKEFITELLEKWSEIVSVANPNVCFIVGCHHCSLQ